MNWTEEQKKAIELRDKNILVAAAAGSGKTAVLVERVKRIILEEKCPVDRMLIVTFTNAAAAEMKEKISRALTEAAADAGRREQAGVSNGRGGASSGKGGASELAFIKRQLDDLPSASISTFHSFALDVIRRYFYLIGVEPDFSICDEIQAHLLKEESLDQLTEELFEEGSPEFYDFLRRYSGDRNEERFREIIEKNYNTLMSLPEPFDWLEKNVEKLKDGNWLTEEEGLDSLFRAAAGKLSEAVSAVKANQALAEEENLEKLLLTSAGDMESLSALAESLNEDSYDGFRQALDSFAMGRLKNKTFPDTERGTWLKKIVQASRKSVTEAVKYVKENYFPSSLEELRLETGKTYGSALYLEKLLLRYDAIYSEKKRNKNLVDFNDVEHYAYRILKDEEAAGFYRRKFRHIFIDEYQDNSILQEAITSLIKRENNLFLVGDVKQCIYKFRLAEPEIFRKKYQDYGDADNSEKIDLNRNFRSKKPVIDFINGIFGDIMEDYDDNAALYPGDPFAGRDSGTPMMYLCGEPWDVDEDVDDSLKAIIKAEKEAMAAVKLINENLGKPIFDSKAGRERPLRKRDIVILLRSIKNYGSAFYKALTDSGIPAYVDDNDGFFRTIEIESFLSALYVIDNPRQDIHLLTLMRSEMLGFSVKEMADVRIGFRTGSYYDAFVSFAGTGEDAALREKCRKALSAIEEWRSMSKLLPLDRLIWKLLLDTGFYIAMGAMPSGSQRQANLRALADMAMAYQSGGGGTLYGFIRYVEAVKDRGVKMGQVRMMGEKDDVVRIMTIHKSKGLEFPMVILAGICRNLRYSSEVKSPSIHKDVGVAFPIVDTENSWYRTTVLQSLIRDISRLGEVEEQKRILYVALTRAKDKLFMLGIHRSPENALNEVRVKRPEESSYFAMAGKAICKNPGSIGLINDGDIIGTAYRKSPASKKAVAMIDACMANAADGGNDGVSDEVRRLLEFEYPYGDDLNVKSKYSVSELNRMAAEAAAAAAADDAGGAGNDDTGDAGGAGAAARTESGAGAAAAVSLKAPSFAAEKAGLTAAERGTAYHCALEHMDVSRARGEGRPYVDALMEELVGNELLSEEEAKAVDCEKLLDFARSDMGRRISESPFVSRERPFNVLTEYGGKQVIAQGMIDCFFEEDGQLVLLDYKTGGRKDASSGYEHVKQRYAVQIDIYRQALEKATGKKVKEAYLYLTDAGEILQMPRR